MCLQEYPVLAIFHDAMFALITSNFSLYMYFILTAVLLTCYYPIHAHLLFFFPS